MHGPFHTIQPLVLASGSPRRQDFLRDQGLEFRIVSAPAAEPLPEPRESPPKYAQRAARAKAMAARSLVDAAETIVAADTIVVLDGEIFGKPSDADHALAMLERMVGREHTVITACCLLFPHEEDVFFERTLVTFAPWPREVLQAYVQSGDSMDKAGAYGMQGCGSFLVSSLNGSWSNVVGLPLDKVLLSLCAHGIIAPNFNTEEPV